jgi:hypothetical protein
VGKGRDGEAHLLVGPSVPLCVGEGDGWWCAIGWEWLRRYVSRGAESRGVRLKESRGPEIGNEYRGPEIGAEMQMKGIPKLNHPARTFKISVAKQ